MATTLRAFDAPDHLVAAAEEARLDEIRHARTMVLLARDFGEKPRPVHVEDTLPATLESLALENTVEGCVRETYAVVRALWQAQHAEDPRLRAALSVIARDESRHAELSWELASWLDTQLDAPARARVEAARQNALVELRHELHGVKAA